MRRGVLSLSSGVPLTRALLQCLRPGEWLNEEIINAYLATLPDLAAHKMAERCSEVEDGGWRMPKIHIPLRSSSCYA